MHVETSLGDKTEFSCGNFVMPTGVTTAEKTCLFAGTGDPRYFGDDDVCNLYNIKKLSIPLNHNVSYRTIGREAPG